jgi:hypothetical protein
MGAAPRGLPWLGAFPPSYGGAELAVIGQSAEERPCCVRLKPIKRWARTAIQLN